MRRNIVLAVLVALVALIPVAAQASAQVKLEDLRTLRGTSNQALRAFKVDIANKPGYVMLNLDYPVTQGDVYTVRYLYNMNPVTLSFFVEADYTAAFSFFGTLRLSGLSYRQLKETVEKTVLKAYPGSLPSVVIESVGVFPVAVKGEIAAPGYAQAWGFSRLSDIIADRLTPYSSIRDVEVISSSGVSRRFDLYQAAVNLDENQNPIIRAGDTVFVHRLSREVFVRGEVYREGAYQLMPNDTVRTLIDSYAGGLTNLADPGDSYVLRVLAADNRTETLYLDLASVLGTDVGLQDMDVIVVPGRLRKLPVVFLEGALFMKPEANEPASASIPWPITDGQRLSTLLASLPSGAITPVSDLERAFVIRSSDDSIEPVDLRAIYYDVDLRRDIALHEGDRVVIPTRFFTVVVAGAVHNPGPQPYVAGKTVAEYMQLAGGIDPELSTGTGILVVDREGELHSSDRVIQPEDKIYVPKNSPSYIYNQRIGPIVTTTAAIVGIVASIMSIIAALK